MILVNGTFAATHSSVISRLDDTNMAQICLVRELYHCERRLFSRYDANYILVNAVQRVWDEGAEANLKTPQPPQLPIRCTVTTGGTFHLNAIRESPEFKS
jgi:hypothetical protein